MEIVKVFVVGIVSIGLVTALFSNGRQTASVIKAGASGSSQLLNTAIKG